MNMLAIVSVINKPTVILYFASIIVVLFMAQFVWHVYFLVI